MTLQSRPYKPAATQCCEACAFGTGKHADFCEKLRLDRAWLKRLREDMSPNVRYRCK